jgi:hypothetical protein
MLTTALFAQAPLPRHPSHQQVVGYALREQQAWNHRQLPANSVLFKSNINYAASHTFLQNRSLMDLPAYQVPYGFTIRMPYTLHPQQEALAKAPPFSFLQLYLSKERARYATWQSQQQWLVPDGLGSSLLRELFAPGGNVQPPQPQGFKRQ